MTVGLAKAMRRRDNTYPLNSDLKDLKLCSAYWAKIDKTFAFCFGKVIVRLLIKATPHFDHSDDLSQSFFTFRTF